MDKFLEILDEKKKKIDSLRPLPKELIKNLEEWFTVELTYSSNGIEGNTLTKSETALVIEKGITIAGKSVEEHLEAINHSEAIGYIKELAKKETLSLSDILGIHSIILKKIDDENAGRLRKIQIKIAGSDTKLPDPIKVPELMEEFMLWMKGADNHPVLVAADAHLKLVLIHPFSDGNGRVARLLMNLLLIKKGYPPAVIKKEDRLAYIESIRKAEQGDDTDDFYNIILRAVDKSLDIYLDMLGQ